MRQVQQSRMQVTVCCVCLCWRGGGGGSIGKTCLGGGALTGNTGLCCGVLLYQSTCSVNHVPSMSFVDLTYWRHFQQKYLFCQSCAMNILCCLDILTSFSAEAKVAAHRNWKWYCNQQRPGFLCGKCLVPHGSWGTFVIKAFHEMQVDFFVYCWFISVLFQAPCQFDDEIVLRQLRYTGMLATVKIRQSGYNYRLLFEVSSPSVTGRQL